MTTELTYFFFSNSQRNSESFNAWEDDPAVADQRHNLRKYPTTSEVVMIEIDKNCSTIGKQ